MMYLGSHSVLASDNRTNEPLFIFAWNFIIVGRNKKIGTVSFRLRAAKLPPTIQTPPAFETETYIRSSVHIYRYLVWMRVKFPDARIPILSHSAVAAYRLVWVPAERWRLGSKIPELLSQGQSLAKIGNRPFPQLCAAFPPPQLEIYIQLIRCKRRTEVLQLTKKTNECDWKLKLNLL